MQIPVITLIKFIFAKKAPVTAFVIKHMSFTAADQQGLTLTIQWNSVLNADNVSYAVYLSNGQTYSRFGDTETNSMKISGAYFPEPGDYSLEVIATAPGWSQTSAETEFEIVMPVKDFKIISPASSQSNGYETHDIMYFTIKNPSSRNIRLRITDGKTVWYVPETGTERGQQPTLTFVPLKSGTYRASVVAYYSADVQDGEAYWGKNDDSQDVVFRVSAGKIESGRIGNGSLDQAADDLKLDDFTKGALLADLIMNEVSIALPVKPFDAQVLDYVLDFFDVNLDIKEYADLKDVMVKQLKQIKAQTGKLEILTDKAGKKIYDDWENALETHRGTENLQAMFSVLEKGVEISEILYNILLDFVTFRSVARDDVQIYIDAFWQSKNFALQNCAEYLTIMTSGDGALAAYLFAAYGGDYAKNVAKEVIYSSALEMLPQEWKVAIKASSLFNNLVFGTSKTMEAAYELEALTSMCSDARNQLSDVVLFYIPTTFLQKSQRTTLPVQQF